MANTANKATPKRETSQAKRLAKLEADVELMAWLHEEMVYTVKVMLTQILLSNPAVQQQLSVEIARRMGQGFAQGGQPGFIQGPGNPTPWPGPGRPTR